MKYVWSYENEYYYYTKLSIPVQMHPHQTSTISTSQSDLHSIKNIKHFRSWKFLMIKKAELCSFGFLILNSKIMNAQYIAIQTLFQCWYQSCHLSLYVSVLLTLPLPAFSSCYWLPCPSPSRLFHYSFPKLNELLSSMPPPNIFPQPVKKLL